MSSSRYPSNWKEIATAVKESVGWRCQKCGKLCLKPGEKTPEMTLSQRRAYTLQVHHWNLNPADNRIENLAPLCTACHLYYHQFRRGNISPGQLSIELKIHKNSGVSR
ncbi:HNH endonuclease [Scytonema sp. NUACC26]|uniref:HNH endonuclease n=1 Tax=Scytonema sp. NUACC26 TaxID=3140176 RepID=UPI0034DBB7EB